MAKLQKPDAIIEGLYRDAAYVAELGPYDVAGAEMAAGVALRPAVFRGLDSALESVKRAARLYDRYNASEVLVLGKNRQLIRLIGMRRSFERFAADSADFITERGQALRASLRSICTRLEVLAEHSPIEAAPKITPSGERARAALALPPDDLRRLEALCARDYTTKSAAIRAAIREYLRKKGV